jgi:hypothetical protein
VRNGCGWFTLCTPHSDAALQVVRDEGYDRESHCRCHSLQTACVWCTHTDSSSRNKYAIVLVLSLSSFAILSPHLPPCVSHLSISSILPPHSPFHRTKRRHLQAPHLTQCQSISRSRAKQGDDTIQELPINSLHNETNKSFIIGMLSKPKN